MALPITIHGRSDCEDTALVRERLKALGLPFRETDVDAEGEAAAVAERHNAGRRTSPTIVFGQEALVISEPGIQTLDAALKRAGYGVNAAHMIQFGPPASDRSAPWFSLPSADGRVIGLEDYRQRKYLIMALAALPPAPQALAGLHALETIHEALTARHAADAVAVVAGDREAAKALAAHLGARLPVLMDTDGRVSDKYAALHARVHLPAIFILDRYGAPRAAGPLSALHATEAVAWIEFLECECDE